MRGHKKIIKFLKKEIQQLILTISDKGYMHLSRTSNQIADLTVQLNTTQEEYQHLLLQDNQQTQRINYSSIEQSSAVRSASTLPCQSLKAPPCRIRIQQGATLLHQFYHLELHSPICQIHRTLSEGRHHQIEEHLSVNSQTYLLNKEKTTKRKEKPRSMAHDFWQ